MSLISDWLKGCFTITELSVTYGVSRKTVYKWINRYDTD
ncbi:MAG: helix-turn-helix domain-containing protein, partial [Nitrospirae bacterium]|nr:helix-turn-helix domain-containing protein [Nitrospirota bacterium]MBI4824196.1 helix-turn-helix domain-containing protein [Nitrospirota bacterium]